MSTTSRVLRRSLGLPAPTHPAVRVARGVAVPMPDGTVLRHDHYRPVPAGGRRPVVLVRTPYGRGGPMGVLFGRVVAERGWHVVVQAVRGTGGSQGELAPFDERDDGVATVRWLLAQPWCDGRLVTLGPSYLGLTQWALAADSTDALVAMGVQVSASQFRDQTYAGGSFSLANALSWTALVRDQARGGARVGARRLGLDRRVPGVLASGAPWADADVRTTGGEVGFWRDWLRESAPDSPYWARRSSATRVREVGRAGVAVALCGGWQDIFLPWQLRDYAELRAAGARPRLVIGPWVHAAPAGMAAGLRESLALFERELDGAAAVPAETTEDAPVVLHLSGGGGRRALADWPPPHPVRSWYLHADHGLAAEPSGTGAADPSVRWPGTVVRYDPRDPTPAVGGPMLFGRAGVRDQRTLEARADVAVFTGPVLAEDLVVVGPARAVVYLRAADRHLDVFVRVCDVDPAGRSRNVTDGLTRVVPARGEPTGGGPVADGPVADDAERVEVELWPLGHRFARGHRVRVQVSGGAHPRFARHPGRDAGLGEADTAEPREREILHDAAHPTRVELPVEAAREQSGCGR